MRLIDLGSIVRTKSYALVRDPISIDMCVTVNFLFPALLTLQLVSYTYAEEYYTGLLHYTYYTVLTYTQASQKIPCLAWCRLGNFV